MAWLDGVFYRPTDEVYGDPRELGLDFEPVTFSARTGETLTGWFFPAEGNAAGTVVHAHGNGGNMTGHFGFVAWLPAAGWNVLCFDYRGYGCSSGRATRRNTIDDVHSAVEYVRGRGDVDSERVVLFGQSLGGAVGLVAAAEGAAVRGVVTDGAFDSYRGAVRWVMERRWYYRAAGLIVSRYFISERFTPIEAIGSLNGVRVLIIQGTEDPIIDWRSAERLHAAAGGSSELLVLEGAGHSDGLEVMADIVRPRMLAFMAGCFNGADG